MRRMTGAVVAVAALLGVATASAATITRTATTASYRLILALGPTVPMYTPAQVKAQHPTSGEVMLSGKMAGDGMSMGGATRHLELHIRSRATGKVLTDLRPSITLTDTTAMAAMAQKVAVATMEGIGEGVSDFHYGNEVSVVAKHTYKVVVVVNGQKATFTFTA